MTAPDPRTLWDLARLQAPPHFESAGQAEVGVRPILYESEPYRGRMSRVFAYLGIPEPPHPAAPRETLLPGMVLVHGGGGTAFREWVAMWNARGYAAIAMDLGGCAADRQPLDGGGPPQSEEAKFADPAENWADHWVYHSVANVIRAHSLLRSLPGVDATRIGLTGISWGGYLTCLVSALDPRFGCAVPVYGCGFLQENSVWIERGSFDHLDGAGRRAWHERCDPSQYVGRATMPLLFSTRPTDAHYRLDSLSKTYSLVPPALLHLAIRVGLGHSHPHGWSTPEVARFAEHAFRRAPALPRPASPQRDGRTLTGTYTADRALSEVFLAFTRDHGPWQERTWQHAPATHAPATHAPATHAPATHAADGTLRAEVPDGTTACFFALTDDLGGYSSSPHVVIGEDLSAR